jgi:DNA-directed RNA polymerase specialized sigma24 family protein
MAGDEPGSVTHFWNLLRAGEAAGADGLWARFFPRLRGLARQILAGRPQRAADAEDAVQSAFLRFWQRVGRGEFGGVQDREDLWRLLGLITVRKARKQARREAAERRGGGRVLDEAALGGPDGEPRALADLVGALPAQDFDLGCAELLEHLDPELRAIALLRLLGWKNREIAEHHDCTERKLHLVRLRWRAVLEG